VRACTEYQMVLIFAAEVEIARIGEFSGVEIDAAEVDKDDVSGFQKLPPSCVSLVTRRTGPVKE